MKDFLNRFNPFYIPRLFEVKKKYITLNWFKGYQLFDLHFWKPQDRSIDVCKKRIMMVGVTLFYFRIELFFEWGHTGPWEG